MATKSLTFDLFGKDKTASSTMKTVSGNATKLSDGFKKAGKGIAIGLAVAAGAIVTLGIDSVKAFADAQESQAKLADSYKRFPKLADTSLESLRDLNTELAKKTRFDDDATASGQAILAQFGLTGEQLKRLTPLMQDYAAKTGKDLPTAAETLGKALLGQGRGLKDIGVDFVDTGTLAGNFDSVVGALDEKVSGFAETAGETANGRLDILKNKFGEVQEKIGEALLPAFEALADFAEKQLIPALDDVATWIVEDGLPAFEDFTTWVAEEGVPKLIEIRDWVVKWKDQLGILAVALGVATAAVVVLNAAMALNPVGLLLVGIALLVGGLVGLANDKSFNKWATGVNDDVNGFIEDVAGAVPRALVTAGVMLATALATIRARVESYFANAISWLTQPGKDVMQGLINGLVSGMGLAARAAATVANTVISTVKGVLGIKSPSKVFEDEVGAMIPAGLVKGITGGKKRVNAAIGDLVNIPATPSAGSAAAIPRADSSPITVMLQSKGGIDLTKYIQAVVTRGDTASVLVSRMGRQVTV